MKRLIFFLFFCFPLTASADSLFVNFSNDTVFVCDYNAWVQCGFQLDYDILVSDSVITLTEIDTAFDMTTCYGFHNFRIPIIGLPEGNYRADIYRDDLYQDVRFIGSFRFGYFINSIESYMEVSKEYYLSDAYPNPFNPTTRMNYYIPTAGPVIITLYDLLGNKIKTILSANFFSGYAELSIDGSELSAGIYFIVLSTKTALLSKKIILIK